MTNLGEQLMMGVMDAEGSSIAKLVSLDEVVGAVRPGLTSFDAVVNRRWLAPSRAKSRSCFCLVSHPSCK